jgi:hypothetical protein
MGLRVMRTFHRFDAVVFGSTEPGSKNGYRFPVFDCLFQSLFGREVGVYVHDYSLLDAECCKLLFRNKISQLDQTSRTLRLETVILRQILALREPVIVFMVVLVESGHIETGSEWHCILLC